MRLWYQSMSRGDKNSAYGDVLYRIFHQVKEPGTEIELHRLEQGGGGGNFRYLEHLETTEVLHNVGRAQREGFDAILIGNINDPGLHAAREIAGVPVLGLCESSMTMASLMGRSFSLVTVNEKYVPRIEETVALSGFKDKVKRIDCMQFRIADMLRGFDDEDARNNVIAAFNKAARRGIDEGAEVVIAAGGGVMAMLASAGVYATEEGVPILNGVMALVKLGEAAARLNKATGGRFTSRRLAYAQPSLDQIGELRRRFGPDIYPTLPKV